MKSKISKIGFLLFVGNLFLFNPCFGEHTSSDTLKRRPLARIRSWIRGTDIKIFNSRTSEQAYCQATPVAKKELKESPGTCLVAYLSAGHCFGGPSTSIFFENLGNVSRDNIEIIIPQSFNKGGNFSKPGDTATLIAKVSCEKAENVKPVPLAPINRDGTTAVNLDETVYLQKRNEAVGGNRGESAQIKAQRIDPEANMLVFHAPSPQGYSIRKGDSGGPIFDSKGRLICPISGSSYENLVSQGRRLRPRINEDSVLDPFEVLCDKFAISRLKQDLAKYGLVPETDFTDTSSENSTNELAATPQTPQGRSARPLLGSPGDFSLFGHGGGTGSETESEGECEGGVCRIPSGGAGNHGSAQNPDLGLSQRPQLESPQVESESIPARSSGGLVETGPIQPAQLESVLEKAKQDGFKHVVIRYGNDASCKYCRVLKNNLVSQFGRDNDVLVIKVDGTFRPNKSDGIPQSELHSLDSKGDWEQVGTTQIGADAASTFKAQVDKLKRTQAQNPSSKGHGASSQTPQPQSAPIRQKASLPEEREETPSAPATPKDVFNGYQFKASEAHGGVHFLSPGESLSPQNGIFLKRQADGSRKAVKKEADGSLTVLDDKIQDGLRQYYAAHQDKIAHLGSKEQAYISDFVKGFGESHSGQKSPNIPRATKNPEKEKEQAQTPTTNDDIDFECVASRGGFSPKKKGEQFRPLGASAFRNKDQCEQAVANSKNGAVCSFTGIGYKPTHFSGSVPKRADYGYLGGSSINNFEDCLKTTLNSTDKAICYFGGSEWYSGDIHGTNNHPAGVPRGPFRSVDACIQAINGKEDLKKPVDSLADRTPEQPKKPEKKEAAQPEPSLDSPSQKQHAGNLPATHGVFGNHCSGCHMEGSQKVNVPTWATDLKELQSRLTSSDPKTQTEAQTWAKKLHQVLVEHNNMPPTEKDRKAMEKDPEVKALREFLTDHQRQQTAAKSPANNAVQVLDSQRLEHYRGMLSRVKVGDKEIEAILRDPSTLLYDDKAMPAGYQDTSLPVQGFRPSGHTTFAEGAPFLDAQNRLKLFTKGVGLNPDAQTFHMLSLPKDETGKLKPIEYWTERDTKDGGTLYRWRFPEGTVSLEAIVQKDSSGKPYVVELRSRKKDGLNPAAEANIFSAAPSKEVLERRLTEIAESNPALAAEARSVQRDLSSLPLQPVAIDNGQYRTRFGSKGATATLPKMSEPLVRELLSELSSARGSSWDSKNGMTAFAPTSDQQFGVVPFHSSRGALGVDRQSCNTCHASANTPVRDAFNYNQSTGAFRDLLNATTYLYGNFPGNDGNLRFHPFDPSTMPVFGRDGVPDNRRINPALAPILKRVK